MSYFKNIKQNVTIDSNNSSLVEVLNVGSAFTGTASSTLGVAGIQVSLKTDQNCIVTVEQSPTNAPSANWDIVDTYKYYAASNFGRTVQAINSYVRVTVTNVGTGTTSYFRLQTALCPIVESIPRSLNSLGYMKNGTFGYDISQGDVSFATPWLRIGYTPTMTTTESDIWSAAGVYTFPATASQMEIVSSNNTVDIATVIKGNAEGANQTILCDAGGTTTTLNDADGAFTSATAVAVGDILLVDPKGTTPEWAYITDVSANTLTFSGGLSSGGSCATARAYTVVDKSARTGAQVVEIDYLTNTFAEKTILMCLNGTTAVTTKDSTGGNLTEIYRVNNFEVIGAGTAEKPTGNLTFRGAGGATTYSYITAGYTMSRSIMYTVPANKNLYINLITMSYGYSSNTAHNARLYTRANVDRGEGFNTGGIFYPYTEVISSNSTEVIHLDIPTKLPAKTDIRVSGIATLSGTAQCSLKGYIIG